MNPHWLHDLALIMLALGAVIACAIAIDEFRRPQPMAIMNVVWPVCALFGTLVVGASYLLYGRPGAAGADNPPFAVSVGKSAAHCGSGCTVGDIIAEWAAFLFPAIAVAFGWQWLFAER